MRLKRSDLSGNEENGDELLKILTECSPNSLTTMGLSSGWQYSMDVLEQFLESCRGRTLKWFELIYHNENQITENNKAIIRKYVNEGINYNKEAWENIT